MKINNINKLNTYINILWSMKSQSIDYFRGSLIFKSESASSESVQIKKIDQPETPYICKITYNDNKWPLIIEIFDKYDLPKHFLMSFNSSENCYEIYIHFDTIPNNFYYRFILITNKKVVQDPQQDKVCFHRDIGICNIKDQNDIEWTAKEEIPVFAVPVKTQIFYNQNIFSGESTQIPIELTVYGIGELNLLSWGDGIVFQSQTITSEEIITNKTINILFDSNKIQPAFNNIYLLNFFTNSKVVNKRNFIIRIHLNINFVQILPVNNIKWKIDDPSKSYIKKFQFNISNSKKPASIRINIPEYLSNYIRCDEKNISNGKVFFKLNAKYLKCGQKINDNIDIYSYNNSNKELLINLPVKIEFPTCNAKMNLEIDDSNKNIIYLKIANNDKKNNFIIRSLEWTKNNFKYIQQLKYASFYSWPIVKPGEQLTLKFRLKSKQKLITSLRINDEIYVKSNSESQIHFKEKVKLIYPPKITNFIKELFNGKF